MITTAGQKNWATFQTDVPYIRKDLSRRKTKVRAVQDTLKQVLCSSRKSSGRHNFQYGSFKYQLDEDEIEGLMASNLPKTRFW